MFAKDSSPEAHETLINPSAIINLASFCIQSFPSMHDPYSPVHSKHSIERNTLLPSAHCSGLAVDSRGRIYNEQLPSQLCGRDIPAVHQKHSTRKLIGLQLPIVIYGGREHRMREGTAMSVRDGSPCVCVCVWIRPVAHQKPGCRRPVAC